MKEEYCIDGAAVTWTELVHRAESLDSEFCNSLFKTTSKAAQILRANGHTVTENSEK